MSIIQVVDQVHGVASFSIVVDNQIVSSFELSAFNSMMNVSALKQDAVLTLNDHMMNIDLIKRWIDSVAAIFVLNLVTPNETMYCSYRHPVSNTGKFSVMGYNYSVLFDRQNSMVTVKARDAVLMQWGSFVKFMDFHFNFATNLDIFNP